MQTLKLVIGDKAFSTWSLRPWLVLKHCDAVFEEQVIYLDQPDTAAQIAEHSPAGKVPVLVVDGESIWDSLAISLWCAEHWPRAGLWPEDAEARARAYSVVCEMHSAFGALRTECSMGPDHPMVGPPGPPMTPSEALSKDLKRLVGMWRDCRQAWGGEGPYLFGRWSIADAFFTPVAARVRHYQLDLGAQGDDGTAETYCATLLVQEDFLEWEAAGLAEVG